MNDLTETLTDYADGARPPRPDLAARAFRAGMRMRRRRHALTGLAAVATALVIAVPMWAIGSGSRPFVSATTPSGSPSPSGSATVSASPSPSGSATGAPIPAGIDGWFLSGGTAAGGVAVWSRAALGYVTLAVDRAWPAPAGDLVVTQHGGHVTLLNLRTGVSRPLPGGDLTAPSWRDDAARVAYTLMGTPPSGVLVDTVTGQVDQFPLATQCGGPCGALSFPPVYDTVAPGVHGLLAPADNGSPGRLYVIDLPSHHPHGSLAVTAYGGGDLSPDLRHVVESTPTGTVVRDRTTGRTTPLDRTLDVRTVRWIDNQRFLAVTHGQLVEFALIGVVVATVDWPVRFVDDELPDFSLSRR